jgi:hypothetical protein
MRKMEELLTAIDPLLSMHFGSLEDSSEDFYEFRAFIGYDPVYKMFGVSISPFGGGNGRSSIFLYSDLKKDHKLYFILYGWKSFDFINTVKEYHKKQDKIVFSARNVFHSLKMGDLYEDLPEEYLEDLHSLCLRIREKWPDLHKAFSDDRVNATYDALQNYQGNDEEEINQIINALSHH